MYFRGQLILMQQALRFRNGGQWHLKKTKKEKMEPVVLRHPSNG